MRFQILIVFLFVFSIQFASGEEFPIVPEGSLHGMIRELALRDLKKDMEGVDDREGYQDVALELARNARKAIHLFDPSLFSEHFDRRFVNLAAVWEKAQLFQDRCPHEDARTVAKAIENSMLIHMNLHLDLKETPSLRGANVEETLAFPPTLHRENGEVKSKAQSPAGRDVLFELAMKVRSAIETGLDRPEVLDELSAFRRSSSDELHAMNMVTEALYYYLFIEILQDSEEEGASRHTLFSTYQMLENGRISNAHWLFPIPSERREAFQKELDK